MCGHLWQKTHWLHNDIDTDTSIWKHWKNTVHSAQELLCLFVYTRTAHGHEQAAFRPIVMEGLSWSNLSNPLLPLPVDTIETHGCCWVRNFLCYFTFCTTSVPQKAKISWNIPSPDWRERGVCVNLGMRAWTNEYGNTQTIKLLYIDHLNEQGKWFHTKGGLYKLMLDSHTYSRY